MRDTRPAVSVEAGLAAPTVGTWWPVVGIGAPVREGVVIGRIVRVGRPLDVVAPKGSLGACTRLAAPGAAVEHGTLLVALGDGVAVEGEEPEETVSADAPPGALAVRAETDGTVYLRPDPGSPLFAPEGDAVGAQATVALVEVMKTFTPARAPVAGTVVRVDVEDGSSVEAGAAILWVVAD